MTFEEVNAAIDAQIETAKKAGAPPLDITMVDKLVRPLSILIALHRSADTDPEIFWKTVAWGMGAMMTELALNLTDKNDPEEVLGFANAFIAEMALHATNGINASLPTYGKPH